MATVIEHMKLPISDADIAGLGALLVDAVESGAAVSFLGGVKFEDAEVWWREGFAKTHARAVYLVARDDAGIVGTVQLQPAWAPNQPHRAEVCKLIVHRRARGDGLGRRLMEEVERAGREAGFKLLTLDAKAGGPAEALYRSMGWMCVGTIPEYALDTDGVSWHDTVIFYKRV